MCLRFVFLLITRAAAWLRLSRRDEAWKAAEILMLRHQAVDLDLYRIRKQAQVGGMINEYHRVA